MAVKIQCLNLKINVFCFRISFSLYFAGIRHGFLES